MTFADVSTSWSPFVQNKHNPFHNRIVKVKYDGIERSGKIMHDGGNVTVSIFIEKRPNVPHAREKVVSNSTELIQFMFPEILAKKCLNEAFLTMTLDGQSFPTMLGFAIAANDMEATIKHATDNDENLLECITKMNVHRTKKMKEENARERFDDMIKNGNVEFLFDTMVDGAPLDMVAALALTSLAVRNNHENNKNEEIPNFFVGTSFNQKKNEKNEKNDKDACAQQ